jgi:RP/EB family microtubule-associated protein
VNNFKILQKAFDSNGITRHIEVQKLVKAKYQDNLEFLQWLKRYFDLNYNGEPYDAVGRRKGNDLFLIGSGNKPVASAPSKAGEVKKNPMKSKMEPSAPKKFVKPAAASSGSTGGAASTSASTGAGSAVQKQKIQELEENISELKLTSDTLEKERDFYFGKLRDIEILLQAYQDQENPNPEDKTAALANLVLKILYATEDEKVEVDENGNVNIVSSGAEVQEEANDMKVDDAGVEGEGELVEGDDM